MYEIVDDAITIDKMALAASVTTSKCATKDETPRFDKSPEIWNFRLRSKEDKDYDPSNPMKIRHVQCGEERCKQIAKGYENETTNWPETQNHVQRQLKKTHDTEKKIVALESKLKIVTKFIVDMEECDDPDLVVTPEMISFAQE